MKFFSHQFSGINGIFLWYSNLFSHLIHIFFSSYIQTYMCLYQTKNLILFYYRILIFPFFSFFFVRIKKYFVGLFISLHFYMHIYILFCSFELVIFSRYFLKGNKKCFFHFTLIFLSDFFMRNYSTHRATKLFPSYIKVFFF